MTATFRGSRDDLRRLLVGAVKAFGGGPDPYGIASGLQLRLGVALLSQIQQDFATKARGGTGRDGITWKPLSPKTVAGRRLGPADKKARTLKARAPQLSESARRAIEKQIRARAVDLRVRFGLDAGSARGLARAQVEAEGRRAGKVASVLSVLGGRQVEILRDTGRLLASFSPGLEDRPSGAAEQLFQTPPGEVIVGTNVPYAARQHAARPFWPDTLPGPWAEALTLAAQRGVAQAVELLTERVL